MKRLLIIDAHSIIHRAYHALPPLTAPDGRPVQAVFGLAKLLIIILREQPDYVVAVSDRPEPTFRKEAFDDYKAHRPETPDDLASQLEESKELFAKFGIRLFDHVGVEADDIAATLVARFKDEPDLTIQILSSDSDLFQLVEDDHVVIRTFKKGVSETVIYNDVALRERYGLEPKQLIDHKALVGDTSDNVPGVPSIGTKTATMLISQFGDIDTLYEHLDEVPRYKDRLIEYREQLMLSRSLVTLQQDVPIPDVALGDLSRNGFNPQALTDYFASLGFMSLVTLVNKPATARRPTPTSQPSPRNLFSGTVARPKPTATISAATVVALSEDSSAHDLALDIPKVGFDTKAILKSLAARGAVPTPPLADLGIAAFLLYPDMKSYDPLTVSSLLTGSIGELDYGKLYAMLMQLLDEQDMRDVYERIEMPLVPVLADVELTGIGVDTTRLNVLADTLRTQLRDLEANIYRAAGSTFNINSPKQVSDVLFSKLSLSMPGKGRKLSTRAEVLTELRDAHPIVPLILEYREQFKLLSTYLVPLASLTDDNGTLRTEYVQTGAATGRLSSRNPNLQNIPHDGPLATELRRAFVARPGYTFVAFDYSQLELRILASLANDPSMRAAFANGEDIHAHTASVILGKDQSLVTKDERRLAKTLNFGLVYGMGQVAFARESGLPRAEAKKFIDVYFSRFSRVKAWQQETLEEARKLGYTSTLTGRRRYFPELSSGAPHIASEAERAAINHPIQGLEADILKLAMVTIADTLKEAGVWQQDVRMLLTIHDELLFEVRDGKMDVFVPRIREIMETAFPSLSVPLTVDVRAGADWGTLSPWDAHAPSTSPRTR